jgi:hypothetical protein
MTRGAALGNLFRGIISLASGYSFMEKLAALSQLKVLRMRDCLPEAVTIVAAIRR